MHENKCSSGFSSGTPWKPKFEILDSQGQQNFIIEGECCFCCPCRDIIFKVGILLSWISQGFQNVGQVEGFIISQNSGMIQLFLKNPID